MLEQWDEICHQWVTEHLTQGSDDQVFASGYLQGHFAVVLAQLEQMPQANLSQLTEQMQQQLAQSRHELAPADHALVQTAWAELSSRLQ